MITPELVTYIRRAKSAGVSNANIYSALHGAGWQAVLADAAIEHIINGTVQNGFIIQAAGLTKVYSGPAGNTFALNGVSLSVRKGESLAIMGKSGSGKSTLMHVLATLDRPTTGALVIDGYPAHQLSQEQLDGLRNKKFSFVFQQFFVNGRNTCLENVMLPLAIMRVPPLERIKRGRAALQAVGLGDKEKSKANDLSGGQKQRLCIARALITEPEVIFADEPTGNLDSENGRAVIDLLFRLQRENGITVIIVTHDYELAALCNRTITIKDGQITDENSHAI